MSQLGEVVRILPQRAQIVAAECIGCAKCLDACPVDAIIGAQRLLHVVIAAQCTGCELCIPPCPVDCIELIAVTEDAEVAQQRATSAAIYSQRKIERLACTSSANPEPVLAEIDCLNRAQAQSTVADVLARARARRA